MFLALGRHGSLSAAARILGVNHATIARRLHALEESMGEKLVERRPDGYVLTPAGTQVLAAASDMAAAARTVRRREDGEALRGLVRVNAPPALSQGFLAARLADLAASHAGLDIDLATDIRAVSLERHETDIAIRMTNPQDGDVIARRLVTVGGGFYATRALCERIAAGEAPVFIGFDEADSHVPDATWLSRQFPRSRVAFRAGNHALQALAAQSGAGIALVPHYIGRTVAGLQPCMPHLAAPPRDVWMLIRRRDRHDPLLRLTAERIAAIFEKDAGLFMPDGE
ncbi:MAG: LysR family transcriptional regulator [Sphingomonadales bacterium]|nr:LysR family transcriptional regulator [Sphingomonadales bacterium]MDE2170738.1 LysR family transcriptional regulator [Sphingomonadales bacterium]